MTTDHCSTCMDSERSGFEKACDESLYLDTETDEAGNYLGHTTRKAWQAWLARAVQADGMTRQCELERGTLQAETECKQQLQARTDRLQAALEAIAAPAALASYDDPAVLRDHARTTLSAVNGGA